MKIAIIGSGNVAWHLKKWLEPKADVYTIDSRTLKDLPSDADIYIITVTDSAIAAVAHKLSEQIDSNNTVVVHTAGTSPLSVISNIFTESGVIYPMQTFTKGNPLDSYSAIPLFIEASTSHSYEKIHALASLMSSRCIKLSSQQRGILHLSAVFACNFVSYLLAEANVLLENNHIDATLLNPLIAETIKKNISMPGYESITGPARRHDGVTMEKHLTLLSQNKELQDVYATLSKNIMNKFPQS